METVSGRKQLRGGVVKELAKEWIVVRGVSFWARRHIVGYEYAKISATAVALARRWSFPLRVWSRGLVESRKRTF